MEIYKYVKVQYINVQKCRKSFNIFLFAGGMYILEKGEFFIKERVRPPRKLWVMNHSRKKTSGIKWPPGNGLISIDLKTIFTKKGWV